MRTSCACGITASGKKRKRIVRQRRFLERLVTIGDQIQSRDYVKIELGTLTGREVARFLLDR